jgi:hypothetical protein
MEKTQTNKIRDKKEDIATNTNEFRGPLGKYFKNF